MKRSTLVATASMIIFGRSRLEIASRRVCRAASLQVMTMIFMVRRVRAAAGGWHRLDPDWAERIVASAAVRPGELVVDLGAGVGALTLPLLEAGARVVAVELHAGRARRLQEKVSDHAASVVECDLENFVPPGRPFQVVANPPYALTAAVWH